MAELFRDTAFGHLCRLVTGKRVFRYPEEVDPSIWTRYLDAQKSGYLAEHGTMEKAEDGEDLSGLARPTETDSQLQPVPPNVHSSRGQDSVSSSRTRVGENAQVNAASGLPVDPEKGRDVNLVGWYGPDVSSRSRLAL